MSKLTVIVLGTILFFTSCSEETKPTKSTSSTTKTEERGGCERLSIIIESTEVQTPEQVILANELNFDEMLGHYKYAISEEDAKSLEISEGDNCLLRICKNDTGSVVRVMKTKIPTTDLEASYKFRYDFKASAFCYTHYR
jgi:hypothetical protein